jgi:hypothetical protein
MRVLQPLIAILAMTGMELDVICSPVAPLQMLHWIQPSDSDDADAKGTPGGNAQVAAKRDVSAERAPLNGKRPNRTKSRSRLHPLPEIYDQVAARSKTRSSALPLFSLGSSPVGPLSAVLPGRGHEHHLHHAQCVVSSLHLACRLRC